MNTNQTLRLKTFNLKQFETNADYKNTAIHDLKKCCREHGFFGLSGHGVPKDLIAEAIAVSKEFFALPKAVKLKTIQNKTPLFTMQQRGYLEKEFIGSNPRVPDAPPDIGEIFTLGKDLNQSQIDQLEPVVRNEDYADNVYPSNIPKMQPIMQTYYEVLESLSHRVHALLQSALEFKIPKYAEDSSVIFINYYPPITKSKSANQWRLSEHSDSNMFTILLPDPQEGKPQDKCNRGGLEIFDKDRRWYRALYDPDCFIINCGNPLEMLADDGSCRSSFHRVSTPEPSTDYDNSRLSIAYFCNAHHDAHAASNAAYEKLHKKSMLMNVQI